MKSIPFVKMSAAGNDFVLMEAVDLPEGRIVPVGSLARQVCDRHFGVGADGLITVQRRADQLEVTTTNPDGSIATVCGNALRAVAQLQSLTEGVSEGELSMSGRSYPFTVQEGFASITMSDFSSVGPPLTVEGFTLYPINTGTEHAVTYTSQLDQLDVESIGSRIAHAPAFSPVGTNVNFVEITGNSSGEVRTFERGVEHETLSCGSGAAAVAVVSHTLGLVRAGRLQVGNMAHSPLVVNVNGNDPTPDSAQVSGRAHVTFKGEFALIGLG